MHEIIWPEKYLPGTTDNFVSNEVIVQGQSAGTVWPHLSNLAAWPHYYHHATNVAPDDGTTTELAAGAHFHFTTFELDVKAEVTEYVAPANGEPGRLAWRAWTQGEPEEEIDVLHAWLVEDLPGGRVRILTQESQIGWPARTLANTHPNPMLNAHQDWLDGLVRMSGK